MSQKVSPPFSITDSNVRRDGNFAFLTLIKPAWLITWITAETHPDYEGDFWADHDEKCHGVIDSAELREEYPDGYIWDCCGETGSHPGCMRGPHKSRFDPVGRTGP